MIFWICFFFFWNIFSKTISQNLVYFYDRFQIAKHMLASAITSLTNGAVSEISAMERIPFLLECSFSLKWIRDWIPFQRKKKCDILYARHSDSYRTTFFASIFITKHIQTREREKKNDRPFDRQNIGLSCKICEWISYIFRLLLFFLLLCSFVFKQYQFSTCDCVF